MCFWGFACICGSIYIYVADGGKYKVETMNAFFRDRSTVSSSLFFFSSLIYFIYYHCDCYWRERNAIPAPSSLLYSLLQSRNLTYRTYLPSVRKALPHKGFPGGKGWVGSDTCDKKKSEKDWQCVFSPVVSLLTCYKVTLNRRTGNSRKKRDGGEWRGR